MRPIGKTRPAFFDCDVDLLTFLLADLRGVAIVLVEGGVRLSYSSGLHGRHTKGDGGVSNTADGGV